MCKQCLQRTVNTPAQTCAQTRGPVVATRNQKGWGGRAPVVSVRGEPELGERLDALAERTNRSRGTYFRMALWAALPSLERMHWEHLVHQGGSK